MGKTRAHHFLVAVLLSVAVVAPSRVKADPPSGFVWEPIPQLSDEFDDSVLNPKKWHDHNPTWDGRQPGYFSPANVVETGGELRLISKLETLPNLPWGYHTFTNAAVKSVKRVLYGYFEVRAKPQNSAVSSAFWFYDNHDPLVWTELDVFELCGKHSNLWMDYFLFTNARVFALAGTGATFAQPLGSPGFWQAPYRFADEYHVYGLEWDENRIRWFIDGVERWSIDNRYWHQPIYMNFDSEIMTYWFENPDPADLPSTFHIDYVRAWAHQGQARKAVYPEAY